VNWQILAAASPVFRSMYASHRSEQGGNNAAPALRITKAEPEVVGQVLDYVHRGSASVLTAEDGILSREHLFLLAQVLEVATRYECRDLQLACIHKLRCPSHYLLWHAGDSFEPGRASVVRGMINFNRVDARGCSFAELFSKLQRGGDFVFYVDEGKFAGKIASPLDSEGASFSFKTSATYPNDIRKGTFKVEIDPRGSIATRDFVRDLKYALGERRAMDLVRLMLHKDCTLLDLFMQEARTKEVLQKKMQDNSVVNAVVSALEGQSHLKASL